mmetsp:Transcript_19746/g.31701  ORF Transcript_19746/g.31701 Transcript_19746/m.31701 type:complete len:85 (-) Transcript_19746:177-431(-)
MAVPIHAPGCSIIPSSETSELLLKTIEANQSPARSSLKPDSSLSVFNMVRSAAIESNFLQVVLSLAVNPATKSGQDRFEKLKLS